MRRQGSPAASPHPAAGSVDTAPDAPRALGATPTPDRFQALFAPRTIAVVGASNDPAKWGHVIARRALAARGDRTVLLVSRRGGEVLGMPTHPSVQAAAAAHDLTVDLAVLCVPAAGFVAAVADAVAAGARAIVAITAGLSETGAEGARREAEGVAIARAADAVLVGPNCLGITDTATGLDLAPTLPVGDVAVLSQSGNLALDLAGLMADRGLGVSRFVSVGNQADLGVVDLMAACVEHDATRAVAVYAEDVVDGRGFVEAARALRAAGKPVVLLAPGRSEAAVRSAVSHTGSLTSSSSVVDAACAAAGVHRVDHLTQLADLLVALRAPRRMAGRRVAVLTDGGGHGAVAAEVLSAAGLQTPLLSGRSSPSSRRRCGPRRRSPTRSTSPVPASETSPAMAGGPAAPGLRPGRRRPADRLLRWLCGLAVRPRGRGAGRGSRDRGRGRRPRQAARGADGRPAEPCQQGAARPRCPGAPRRRSRGGGAGRTGRHADHGSGRRAAARGSAGHRHLVPGGPGAVRAGRDRVPCRAARSRTRRGWRQHWRPRA